jgi:hypothetical protein
VPPKDMLLLLLLLLLLQIIPTVCRLQYFRIKPTSLKTLLKVTASKRTIK